MNPFFSTSALLTFHGFELVRDDRADHHTIGVFAIEARFCDDMSHGNFFRNT